MKSKIFSILLSLVFALTTVLPVLAAPPAAPAFVPSTPEDNKLKGWAYHEVVPVPGGVEITLYAPRNFWSCIEYRADDEAPQDPNHPYLVLSPLLADGQFRDLCGRGDILPVQTIFVAAGSHVDIRMSYGAEGNERYYGWLRYSAGPSVSTGSSEQSNSPNVCNMTLESAPEWIPYGDANVELHWPANGCDVHIRSLDGGPWIKLSFQSKSYTTDGGWVGVLAPLPFGVSPGWNLLTMGVNSVKVWVGHTPPPDSTSWILPVEILSQHVLS